MRFSRCGLHASWLFSTLVIMAAVVAFETSAQADSQSFMTTVQPGQSLDFTVTTDAFGPINYTLIWLNGAPLQSCIYAPGAGDPDACGTTPSPQPVSDSPTAIGTFTVRVSLTNGYPATDLTLVVNYPTMATDAFVGNEVRDDVTIPPNKWKFGPADTPSPVFQVRGGDQGYVDYSLDGGQTYTTIAATYVINAGANDVVTATIPAQPLDTAVAYRTRAVAPGGSEAQRNRNAIYFVSDLPRTLAEVPDNPPFYGATGFPSPAAWRDQSIYMLMTDRFNNADTTNDRLGFSNFNASRGNTMHGGDWAGITARLDYLQQLGITAIWITPVPQNFEAYHGYAAADFLLPGRQNGTLQELRNLVSAAHSRGMYVILDLALNHQAQLIFNFTDDTFQQFDNSFNPNGHVTEWAYVSRPDFGKPLSYPEEFRDKTHFHPYGYIDNYDDQGSAFSHAELGELSGLNDFKTEDTSPGGIRSGLIKIAKWWIANTDVDGFRMDAVKHIELAFWHAFATEIKNYARNYANKDNFFLTGEFLQGDDNRLYGYTGPHDMGLDSLLYYPMYYTIQSVFKNNGATKQIDDRYMAAQHCGATHDQPCYASNDLLCTFIDNHDQSRFLNGTTTDKLKVALGFLYTGRGIPALYYGTEQGFNGNRTSGCTGGDCNREDMFANPAWDGDQSHPGDNFNTSSELFQYIAQLNQIRAQSEPLRRGAYLQRWQTTSGPGLFVFSRTDETEEVLVVLNTSNQPQIASPQVTTSIIQPGTVLHDQLSSATVTARDAGAGITRVDINVGSYGVQIFKP